MARQGLLGAGQAGATGGPVVGGIGGRSLKPAGRVSPATASIPPPSFVHRRPICRCIEYIANSCVECPALRDQHTLAVWAPALQPQTSGRQADGGHHGGHGGACCQQQGPPGAHWLAAVAGLGVGVTPHYCSAARCRASINLGGGLGGGFDFHPADNVAALGTVLLSRTSAAASGGLWLWCYACLPHRGPQRPAMWK